MEKIFDCEIAVTTFYRGNKSIMPFSESRFKEWIVENNYATHIRDNFISTQWAKENGLMINKTKVIIDTEPFDLTTTFSGYITPKGQKSIIDKIMKESEKDNGKKQS